MKDRDRCTRIALTLVLCVFLHATASQTVSQYVGVGKVTPDLFSVDVHASGMATFGEVGWENNDTTTVYCIPNNNICFAGTLSGHVYRASPLYTFESTPLLTLPGGISALCGDGGVVVAADDQGNVRESFDSGESWAVNDVGVGVNACACGSSGCVLGLDSCTIAVRLNSQSDAWVSSQLCTPSPQSAVVGVAVLDAYAVGENVYVVVLGLTKSAGMLRRLGNNIYGDGGFAHLVPVNITNGADVACTGDEAVCFATSRQAPALWQSINGGSVWTELPTGTENSFNMLSCEDVSCGSGNSNYFLYTSPDGVVSPTLSKFEKGLTAVSFVGYAAAYNTTTSTTTSLTTAATTSESGATTPLETTNVEGVSSGSVGEDGSGDSTPVVHWGYILGGCVVVVCCFGGASAFFYRKQYVKPNNKYQKGVEMKHASYLFPGGAEGGADYRDSGGDLGSTGLDSMDLLNSVEYVSADFLVDVPSPTPKRTATSTGIQPAPKFVFPARRANTGAGMRRDVDARPVSVLTDLGAKYSSEVSPDVSFLSYRSASPAQNNSPVSNRSSTQSAKSDLRASALINPVVELKERRKEKKKAKLKAAKEKEREKINNLFSLPPLSDAALARNSNHSSDSSTPTSPRSPVTPTTPASPRSMLVHRSQLSLNSSNGSGSGRLPSNDPLAAAPLQRSPVAPARGGVTGPLRNAPLKQSPSPPTSPRLPGSPDSPHSPTQPLVVVDDDDRNRRRLSTDGEPSVLRSARPPTINTTTQLASVSESGGGGGGGGGGVVGGEGIGRFDGGEDANRRRLSTNGEPSVLRSEVADANRRRLSTDGEPSVLRRGERMEINVTPKGLEGSLPTWVEEGSAEKNSHSTEASANSSVPSILKEGDGVAGAESPGGDDDEFFDAETGETPRPVATIDMPDGNSLNTSVLSDQPVYELAGARVRSGSGWDDV